MSWQHDNLAVHWVVEWALSAMSWCQGELATWQAVILMSWQHDKLAVHWVVQWAGSTMSWCRGELAAQSAGGISSWLLDELATQQVGGSRNEWYDELAVFGTGTMNWRSSNKKICTYTVFTTAIFWLMYSQVGDFCVCRGTLSIPLTWISNNTVFFKSQNPHKAGTLCTGVLTSKFDQSIST